MIIWEHNIYIARESFPPQTAKDLRGESQSEQRGEDIAVADDVVVGVNSLVATGLVVAYISK
jgi:hypothetical protein